MPMVLTITFNPAVDQTAKVGRLRAGHAHRLLCPQLHAAGKGINVARVTHRLGWRTAALGFVGGDAGTMIERALDSENVEHHFVRVAGETRVNLTIVDEAGIATSFLGPGPRIDGGRWNALLDLTRQWLEPGRVLVLAGSLPPGVREDGYAMYIHAARERNVRVVLDADDQPMRLGIEAGPDLIKPNVAEAERLVGRSLADPLSIVDAARELAERVPIVVLSMGERGAICAHGSRILRAFAPRVQARSSVGMGDAMVAGLAVTMARGGDIVEGIRLGVATGTAAAMVPGTAECSAEQVRALLGSVAIGEMLSEPQREVIA
jgi:1-phosphofructokinase family hexose kinase